MKDQVLAHFIVEHDDSVLMKLVIHYIPSVGDSIRTGGESNEKYYRVTCVVFVYDEILPYSRVNIGITEIALADGKE